MQTKKVVQHERPRMTAREYLQSTGIQVQQQQQEQKQQQLLQPHRPSQDALVFTQSGCEAWAAYTTLGRLREVHKRAYLLDRNDTKRAHLKNDFELQPRAEYTVRICCALRLRKLYTHR